MRLTILFAGHQEGWVRDGAGVSVRVDSVAVLLFAGNQRVASEKM